MIDIVVSAESLKQKYRDVLEVRSTEFFNIVEVA